MRRGQFRIVGDIRAGFPSAAEGYEDEPLNLHDWIVRHPAATFLFRVRGRELHHEGIREGSVLVVDRSVRPAPHKLVLAEEEGLFIVRRFPSQPEPMIVFGTIIAVVTRLS